MCACTVGWGWERMGQVRVWMRCVKKAGMDMGMDVGKKVGKVRMGVEEEEVGEEGRPSR